MKPYLLILLLTLALASVGHAASEYTITNRHRVIEEDNTKPKSRPYRHRTARR